MKTKKRLGIYSSIILIVIGLYIHRQSYEVSVSSANASLPLDSQNFQSNSFSPSKPIEGSKTSERFVESKNKTDSLSIDQLLYCQIHKLNSGVPLDGSIKMQIFSYDDDGSGQPGKTAMIQSDRCPVGTYSVVKLDGLGRLGNVIDCRVARSELLEINAGVQGNVFDVSDTKSSANIAISGDGFFVLRCPSTFKLTRSGNFHRIESKLISSDGCTVLDRNGSDFVANGEINELGCDSTDECIAIAQPKSSDNIQLNRPRELETTEDVSSWILKNPRVFTNSLEELSEVAGPDWRSIPNLEVPNCN